MGGQLRHRLLGGQGFWAKGLSAAFWRNSAEIRCRVTPNSSAIASIVNPSARRASASTARNSAAAASSVDILVDNSSTARGGTISCQ